MSGHKQHLSGSLDQLARLVSAQTPGGRPLSHRRRRVFVVEVEGGGGTTLP